MGMIWKIIKWSFLLLIGSFILFKLTHESTPEEEAEAKNFVWRVDATLECKERVKQLLKSPSTANFGGVFDSKFYQFEKNKIVYINHVDAQNSFGAVVRNKFICQMDVERTEDGTLGARSNMIVELTE